MEMLFPSSSCSLLSQSYNTSGIDHYLMGYKEEEHVKVRCPLCNTKASVIYCVDCIRTGKFSHSEDKNEDGDKYMEKRVNEVRLRGQMRLMSKDILELAAGKRRTAQLIALIERQRRKNCRMKEAVKEHRANVASVTKQYAKVNAEIDHRKNVIKQNENLMSVLNNNVQTTKKKGAGYKKTLESYRQRLKVVNSSYIKELLTHILPVEYMDDKVTRIDDLEYDDVVHLQDDGGGNLWSVKEVHSPVYISMYSVGGLLVPTADTLLHRMPEYYQRCNRALCLLKSSSQEDDGLCQVIATTAALTNTAMLLNILAVLMQVTLPHYLSHAEFNDHTIPDDELRCLVTKLNLNIVYFCLAAGVHYGNLYEYTQTMSNFNVLLQHLPIDRPVLTVTVPDALHQRLLAARATFSRSAAARTQHYLPYRNTPLHDTGELQMHEYHFVSDYDIV